MSTPTPDRQNPYAPPRAAVQDIADPDAPLELAGRATRLGAYFLDSVILVIVCLPLVMGAVFKAHGGIPQAKDLMGGGLFITLLAFIAWAGITISFVHANGQSIAKRMLGIKVVRKDGSRASLGRIFWLRNVINAIPSSIPFVGYLYQIADELMIFGETRQCLHDRIADTIVVKA